MTKLLSCKTGAHAFKGDKLTCVCGLVDRTPGVCGVCGESLNACNVCDDRPRECTDCSIEPHPQLVAERARCHELMARFALTMPLGRVAADFQRLMSEVRGGLDLSKARR